MTNDEIIAVVQAHKEGKKIERRLRNSITALWLLAPDPVWNFNEHDYRVALEPRKPRELVLIYKGNGTWKEIESCGMGLSEHPVRFMEVI